MQMKHSLPLQVAVTFTVCALLIGRETMGAAPGRDQLLATIEPPERPQHFRNLDELNEYLTQLRHYYQSLGRPRLVWKQVK